MEVSTRKFKKSIELTNSAIAKKTTNPIFKGVKLV